jgi:hypothetical protein
VLGVLIEILGLDGRANQRLVLSSYGSYRLRALTRKWLKRIAFRSPATV